MQGLRDKNDLEDLDFQKFFTIVQKQANSKNSVFFLECEEGHERNVDGIDCMNFTGWLIPKDKAEIFEKKFLSYSNDVGDDEWLVYSTGTTWQNQNGEIKISFQNLFWGIELCRKDNH